MVDLASAAGVGHAEPLIANFNSLGERVTTLQNSGGTSTPLRRSCLVALDSNNQNGVAKLVGEINQLQQHLQAGQHARRANIGSRRGEVIFDFSFVNLSDWVLEGERPVQERRDCIDGGREQIGFVAQDVQASWREEFGRGERLGENGGEEIGCQAAGAEFHVRDQIARREFPGGRISRARGLRRHRAATWRGRFAQAADPGRRTSSISARTLRPQQVQIVSSLLGRWP